MVKAWLFDIFSYPYSSDARQFDPQKCQSLFDWHMESWELAEKVGFEGIFFSEHHFTAYNLSPSPNLLIAAIAQRTKRIRLGVMVNVLPMHNPRRYAEECAMLDYLTHGRLEIGVGRGIDEKEFRREGIRMEELRERFEEGMRFVMNSLNNTVFTHKGKLHNYEEETSLWPQPLKRPVTRPWISAASAETLTWAGTEGYQVACAFNTLPKIKDHMANYRKAAAAAGHHAGPENTMWMVPTFCADTDAEAHAIAEPAMNRNIELFREAVVFEDLEHLPKSYEAYADLHRPFKASGAANWKGLQDAGFAVVGSPATVRARMLEIAKFLGTGNVIMWCCFGNLTREQTLRSLELIGREVIPALNGLKVE